MKRIPSILLGFSLIFCPVYVMAQEDASSSEPVEQKPLTDTDAPFSAQALVSYTAAVAEASKLPSCEETRKAIKAIPSDLRRHAALILLIPEVYDLNSDVLNEIRGFVRVAASQKTRCPVVVDAYRDLAADAASQDKK